MFHYESLLSKIYRRETKLLVVISLERRGIGKRRLHFHSIFYSHGRCCGLTEYKKMIYLFSCSFDIRLMKEGRMKGQAFVTFPSNELAAKAMSLLHGYILHEKPVIIVSSLSYLVKF